MRIFLLAAISSALFVRREGGTHEAFKDLQATDRAWKNLIDVSKAQKLGSGGYGTAYLVPLKCSNKSVVIKHIVFRRGQNPLGPSPIDMGLEELEWMGLGRPGPNHSPNLLGYWDFFPRDKEAMKAERQLFIMMEPMFGGELHKQYRKSLTQYKHEEISLGNVSESEYQSELLSEPDAMKAGEEDAHGAGEYVGRNKLIAKMACEITSGLEALHAGAGYLKGKVGIHRDVKPANVWASKETCTGEDTECRYVLGDFGLTTSSPDEYRGGTPEYQPPELRGSPGHELLGELPTSAWSPKGDVYSLGFTLYKTLLMNSNSTPSAWRTKIWYVPEEIHHLLDRMLEVDYRKRADSREARELACAVRDTYKLPHVPAPPIPECVDACRDLKCETDISGTMETIPCEQKSGKEQDDTDERQDDAEDASFLDMDTALETWDADDWQCVDGKVYYYNYIEKYG